MAIPVAARCRLRLMLAGTLLTLLVIPPARGEETSPFPAKEEVDRDRERIGEVLGKPVYRDQIRLRARLSVREQLLDVFAAPVMEKYRKKHKSEIEPTKAEIDAATTFLEREHRKRIKDEEPRLRQELKTVETQLKEGGLTKETKQELERKRRILQAQLKPNAVEYVIPTLRNWKLQRHLYENFGGGRVLLRNHRMDGREAFDAMHTWLQDRERRGEFRIADPKLRAEFFKWWTTSIHGSYLIEEKDRIRSEFLEPEWAPKQSDEAPRWNASD